MQLRMLCERGAGRVVPFLDLRMFGAKPVTLWRVTVREIEVTTVRDVVVFSSCARLHHPEHAGAAVVVLVLKDGAMTQVDRVSICHLNVGRRPGNTGSFGPPRNSTPEINSFFYAALFAFVARDL